MTMTPIPKPPDALETLCQVNENLRFALLRLRPERKHCSSIRPQDFSNILSQLLLAAECLRRPKPLSRSKATVALEKESQAYRSNLEKLKRFLPDVQVRLLTEKSRLETARTHVATAAAWAQARKKAL
jgi:superfamily I DNA and/or RNA helicase